MEQVVYVVAIDSVIGRRLTKIPCFVNMQGIFNVMGEVVLWNT